MGSAHSNSLKKGVNSSPGGDDDTSSITTPTNGDQYPTLVMYKDVGCQTDISYILQPSKIHTSYMQRLIQILVLYFLLCTLMMFSSTFQCIMTYSHIALFKSNLSNLNEFGLSEAHNIELRTHDGLMLRGWHLLPPGNDTAIIGASLHGTTRKQYFEDKLRHSNRIIIFFHGRSGTRGYKHRPQLIKHLAASLDSHVIAIDYRGFADSEGWPSEHGTRLDALAVIQWILQITNNITMTIITNHSSITSITTTPALHNAKSHHAPLQDIVNVPSLDSHVHIPSIFLYGQSLGGAVAIQLAVDLDEHMAGVCKGIVTDAAFSTLAAASRHHPIGAIFRIFPFISDIMASRLRYFYLNVDKVSRIRSPLLILHGVNDWMIPLSQARDLYTAARKDWNPLDYKQGEKQQNDEGDYNNCNNNDKKYLRLVEVEGAEHSSVFKSFQWLAEVPKFVKYAESVANNNSNMNSFSCLLENDDDKL